MILKSYSTFVFVKFLLNLTFLFSTVSKASAFSLLTYFSLTSDSFLKSLMLDGFLVSSLGLGSTVGFLVSSLGLGSTVGFFFFSFFFRFRFYSRFLVSSLGLGSTVGF